MNDKIEVLLKSIDSGSAMLVTNESNVSYLTGFTGEASYLIVSNEKSIFITDGRYYEQAIKECKNSTSEIIVTKWHGNKKPDYDTIVYYLNELKIKKMMFNDTEVSFRNYTVLKNTLSSKNMSVELWPISGLIENLRTIKTDEEIKYIRKACEIADKALEMLLSDIKIGVSELELVAKLEYNLKISGADNISFDTIILSGTKTSLPHGKPSSKKLEKGDFLQFDFGALYKGYHSDMSRTFIINEATDEQINLYEMMYKATTESTEILKSGIFAKLPDDIVRNIISEEYLKYYYPGLGHGVGLDIHEVPFLSQSSSFELKTRNIITIEPGVYIPNWGGMRIEDTILIKEDGYEVLTKFPRKLMILG